MVTIADEPPTSPAWRVEYSLLACASPTCACCDLGLLEESEGANDHDGSRESRTEFVFDVVTRTVRPANHQRSATMQLAAATLTAALPAALAERLVEIFFTAKARAFAEFDGTQSTADFPFDDVEQNRIMVPLRRVIPFATNLAPPVIDGRELAVDEQYCVVPGCDCSRTVVGIGELTPVDHDPMRRDCLPVVDFLVDWRHDRWSVAGRNEPLTPGEVAMRDALLAANPDLFATLQRRHRMMHTLYANSAAAAGRTPARPATRPATRLTAAKARPKAGRNDPCPCGSGKKAKRCCQSAGGPRTDSP